MRVPDQPVERAIRAEVKPGVWIDSRLALWLSHERVLVVADLHWGYAASHRARGNLLPAWGDDEIEGRLASLVRDYAPLEMVWLGDVVHAAEGAARAESFLRTASCPVTLIAGNHDRRWRQATQSSAVRGGYFLHHGDVERPQPPGTVAIIGHHHPAVAWSDGAGGNVRLPALVVGPARWVLPAFSPWAAGSPCANLLTDDASVWAVAPRRIFVMRPHQTPVAV